MEYRDVRRALRGVRRGAGAAALAAALTFGAGLGSRAAEPVTIAGFALPESAFYDAETDTYLVANINGAPLDKDGNGFVSRLSPDGKILALKWIDGAQSGIRLDAPKGMAIAGGILWIADIDVVRRFDAKSGAQLVDVKIEGATFLNDVAADGDGVVVSDSGLNATFAPTGTDAVFRIARDGKVSPLVKSPDLGKPNGVVVSGGSVFVVTFGSGELLEIGPAGERKGSWKLPAGQLDGIVALDNGDFLISGWAGETVYRGRGASWTAAVTGVKSPGDIGFDTKRRVLLVPLLQQNAVRLVPIN